MKPHHVDITNKIPFFTIVNSLGTKCTWIVNYLWHYKRKQIKITMQQEENFDAWNWFADKINMNQRTELKTCPPHADEIIHKLTKSPSNSKNRVFSHFGDPLHRGFL